MYPIPPNATRIRYLESTGTQYIDTGVIVGPTTEIVAGFTCTNSSKVGLKAFFGVSDSTHGESGLRTSSSGYAIALVAGVGVQNNYDPVSPREVNSTINFGTGSCFVQIRAGASYIRNASGTASQLSTAYDIPMYVFATNDGTGPTRTHSVRLRSLTITQSGTFVRDFVPVRVGTVGYLFDRVSGQLFGNAGTGDFVLGPDTFAQGVVPTRMMPMGVRRRLYGSATGTPLVAGPDKIPS